MKFTHFYLFIFSLLFFSPIFGQDNKAKRIAILETIDKEGNVAYGIKLMVRSQLCAVITETPGYEGFDRVDVSSIISEHEFQRTGLVNDNDIRRLGEMTGADFILVTEVAYINSSNIFLTSKILNVETAHVEQTANVQTKTNVEDIEYACRLLASKLLNVNIDTGALRGELMYKGNRYVGEYKDGLPHGEGIMYFDANDKYQRMSYEGDWINGLFDGKGVEIWLNGSKYEGDFKKGLRNGYGICYYSSGGIYKGNWRDDKKNGEGHYSYPTDNENGILYYDGYWIDGVKHGHGKMVWSDGDYYEGNWMDDDRHGKGTYVSGNTRYEGTWENDIRQGLFIETYIPSGYYKKGRYINGKKEGEWNSYDNNGKPTFTDQYRNGKQLLLRQKFHY